MNDHALADPDTTMMAGAPGHGAERPGHARRSVFSAALLALPLSLLATGLLIRFAGLSYWLALPVYAAVGSVLTLLIALAFRAIRRRSPADVPDDI